jgi:uncharacterized membrane-anchored protein YhcB (DUF1043 family)
MDWNLTFIAGLTVGLALGAVVGVLLQRRSGGTARARAEQLAAELDETREELSAQRDEVTRHFQQTSNLFRDLTERYSQLYTHLADGARQFCTDDLPALARGYDGPLLGNNGDGQPAPEPGEAEQSDQSNGGRHVAA